ncbi:MAG: HutD family protein [Microbacteriaceae bacterium]|nr:HutD family protein [Microbacteriaceae bacterium]
MRNVIAWKDLTAEPWRNGDGVTRQILSRRRSGSDTWLPAADDWDWRLSIADVDSSGPFSSFPGMTRILTVIEGVSVTLTVDGAVEELEKLRPFRFDGGAESSAVLPHGSIRDLNLIARTSTVDAQVRIETLSAARPHLVSEGQYCVILGGRAQLLPSAAHATAAELERFDTVIGDSRDPLTITGEGIVAVIMVFGAHST